MISPRKLAPETYVNKPPACGKNQQVSHLLSVIAMLEPLCFVPQGHLGQRGAGDHLQSQGGYSVALRTSWKDEEWPESLEGLLPDLQQLLNPWLGAGQG